VAATTWTTIAHSQTSGNSGSAGSALSSSPSGLRIELVTTDASSSYVFWTDTCSASGTPSVHYGMYNVPTNATSYHSLPVHARTSWCSVVWDIGEGTGTTKMYLQRETAINRSPPTTVVAQSNVVLFSCTGNAPGVDITFGSDSSNHQGPTVLPWSAQLGLDNSAMYYDISAQLHGSGNVTCSVTVKWGSHSVTKKASAYGGYNIADAEICNMTDMGSGWQAC